MNVSVYIWIIPFTFYTEDCKRSEGIITRSPFLYGSCMYFCQIIVLWITSPVCSQKIWIWLFFILFNVSQMETASALCVAQCHPWSSWSLSIFRAWELSDSFKGTRISTMTLNCSLLFSSTIPRRAKSCFQAVWYTIPLTHLC